MKTKFKYISLAVLFVISFIAVILSTTFISKKVNALTVDECLNQERGFYINDVADGNSVSYMVGDGSGINPLATDFKSSCIDYCNSHGPGRESGGPALLNTGCRNYMASGFIYGATDIPYWINMSTINKTIISSQIISEIRTQSAMWNQAKMHDGTGQIVNIYEVNANLNKPTSINGKNVIEVTVYDFLNDADDSNDNAVGQFNGRDTIKIDYNFNDNTSSRNIDTVVHEFGHVLGLDDIDAENKVSNGTHKTLMGYFRSTTAATLPEAIKYQDIQGIAVMTGKHVCKDEHLTKYVKYNNKYCYICFYCDRITCLSTIIPGSEEIKSSNGCMHDYRIIVSCGDRIWGKCTKCYKVNEFNQQSLSKRTISFSDNGVLNSRQVQALPYETMPEINMFAPKKEGYAFDGYYDSRGVKYYEMRVVDDRQTADFYGYQNAYVEKVFPVNGKIWDHTADTTLYARWRLLESNVTYENVTNGKVLGSSTVRLKTGKNVITPQGISNYKFSYFIYDGRNISSNEIDLVLYRTYSNTIMPKGGLSAYYEEDSCLAAGSIITLADGSLKAVENLTGDEMLLVWNLYTGTYDSAPILFIDSDPEKLYKVINLSFSDGTTVKVISEHGFWDCDLNKYVYLDENAGKYIGHWFNKGEQKVKLVGVEIREEYTTAWSPVTYSHLCYYVNGMLSMPGGIEGLFNIFEVDHETMKYDEAAMQADIEKYGLFEYEEFSQYLALSEEAFEAYNGKYLKIAIGKGLTTFEELAALYERYGGFFA